MKKILTIISLMLLVLVVALASTFTLTATADNSSEAENVIYISGNPTVGGDGSSPDKPLSPKQYSDNDPTLEPMAITQGSSTITALSKYKNTALYQAVEKLAETGGTVVLIDDYKLTDDDARQTKFSTYTEFHLPITKKAVTITSKYNGVDYSVKSGAKLTLSGKFFILLNGPTVWENLTIHSELVADRAICCNGYTTVFGEGLKCTKPADKEGWGYYPSIAGGTLNTNFSKNVHVTIKSGTFYKLVGTSWLDGDNITECNGDVNIKIEGGTVQYVLGNSNNNVNDSIHSGNVDITVTGGKDIGAIVCTGAGGFKSSTSRVNIKITDGEFLSWFRIRGRMVATGTEGGYLPGTINIDLSGASNVSDATLNHILDNLPTNASGGTANVTYPAKWATSVTKLESPVETFVFVGEEPSSKGASVKVTYNNGQTQTVEYNKNNSSFRAGCNTSTAGKTTATYYYGDKVYHTATVNVIAVPKVTFKGVQIRTNSRDQQMYGWGGYEGAFDSKVTVERFGIIAISSEMLATDEPFDHSNTYGMYDEKADYIGDAEFRALVFGSATIRENNYKTDYSLRAYIKIKYEYETGKFAERYIYSDVAQRNFYDVAKKAIANSEELSESKSYLATNVISVSDNYNMRETYNQSASDAARNKVVKYMEDMMNVTWTAKETFILYNEGTNGTYSVGEGSTAMYAVFEKGETYRGIPYINASFTQAETFNGMIEADGFWNAIQENNSISKYIANIDSKSDLDSYISKSVSGNSENINAIKQAGLENAKLFPGNDCVTSLVLAWNTVLNNRSEVQSMTSVTSVLGTQTGSRNGVISVGDFDLSNYYNYFTQEVTTANGEQVMAKAYAELKRGDATVYSGENGNANNRHVRMVYSTPVVVKNNSTGVIDLDKSYVMQIDQAAGTNRYIWTNSVNLDANGRIIVNGTSGSSNKNAGSIQVIKKTFRELYKEGSLPITIPELVTGNVDAEFTYASEMNLEDTLPNGVLSGAVKSNRQIISVRAVFSQGEKTIYEEKTDIFDTYWQLHIGEYNLSDLDLSGLDLTSGENYEFNLYACVSGINGKEVHLVSDYEFTAK